jgi:hypothetical protein
LFNFFFIDSEQELVESITIPTLGVFVYAAADILLTIENGTTVTGNLGIYHSKNIYLSFSLLDDFPFTSLKHFGEFISLNF